MRDVVVSREEAREKVLLREEERSRYLDWYAKGLLRALGLAAGNVGFACWSIILTDYVCVSVCALFGR